MDWLAFGTAIDRAGGWAAFLGLIALIGIGLWRRWWVPGFWFTEVNDEVKALRKAVLSLTTELARERRRRRSDAP